MKRLVSILVLTAAVSCLAVEKVRLLEPSGAPKTSYSTRCCIVDAPGGALLATIGPEIRRSTDDGRTWSSVVTQDRRSFSRNLLRLGDGRLMKVWSISCPNVLTNRLGAENFYVSFSSDEGRTWGGKRTVLERNERVYLMNDRPIRMKSGRLVIPFSKHPNHLLAQKLESCGWAGACYSDDDGRTWTEGTWYEPKIADQLCEPAVFERRDGSLKMIARTGRGHLYELVSVDGGATWGGERATTLRQPCAPFAVRKDPRTGWVFVVWNNTFPAPRFQFPRTPFCLGVSKDDGETWSIVKELGANPEGSYGYPTIHFTKDAVLVAHYEDATTRNFRVETQTLELEIISRKELTGK